MLTGMILTGIIVFVLVVVIFLKLIKWSFKAILYFIPILFVIALLDFVFR